MDLETEIPIWYNGKMKWISNLTTRSTCTDVIEAILSNGEHLQSNEEYILYESWRGVERPLKSRCRLLKLWHAWAGESSNVTLSLRTHQQPSTSTHFLLRKQDKKLIKLKRQLKRTDKQIEKFSHIDSEKNNNSSMSNYLHLYRSIINTQTQLEYQQKLISNLMSAIENENPEKEFSSEDLAQLLTNVNQTLMISRQLTEQSEELDEQIEKMNEEIDRKQYLLDELELDDALDQNIDLDSLDDEEQTCGNLRFNQERVSTKDISPSPSLLIPQKLSIKNNNTFAISSRPTAIVEPSLSLTKSKSFSESPLNKTRFHVIPFPLRQPNPWSISPNEESDTGISSFNSTDEQLVTLV